jgi:hypothetical protein
MSGSKRDRCGGGHLLTSLDLMTNPTTKGHGKAAPQLPDNHVWAELEFQMREEELRACGLVRAKIVLPIHFNERQKSLARKAGKKADEFMGEHYMKLYKASRQEEAIEEAARLKEQFGDDWFEILGSVPLRPGKCAP